MEYDHSCANTKPVSSKVLWFWRLFPFVLLFVGFAIYGVSLSGGFLNFDDPEYIIDQPLVKDLSLTNLRHAFTSTHFTDYAPLNTIALALEYAAWGPTPLGFRVVNFTLHVLNASIVFWILCSFFERRSLAALGSILFLVHPLQVEGVAWISEHKLLLTGSFFFAAMLTHIRSAPRWVTVMLGIAAMLTRASAIVLPPLIVVYDVVIRKKRWRSAVVDAIPLGFFAMYIAGMNILSEHVAGAIKPAPAGLVHLWGVLSLPGRYLAKVIWPIQLCALYKIEFGDIIAPQSIVYVIASLALMSFFVLAIRRRKTLLVFGLSWWFVAWLPVSNIIPLPVWMADRYMYLPMAGVAICLGALLSDAKEWVQARKLIAVAIVVMVVYGVMAHRRSTVWMTSLKFWSDNIMCAPCAVSYAGLAWALMDEKKLDKALMVAERAIMEGPGVAKFHMLRGEVFFRLGLREEGVEDFAHAIVLMPGNSRYWQGLMMVLKDAPLNLWIKTYRTLNFDVDDVNLGDRFLNELNLLDSSFAKRLQNALAEEKFRKN